MKETVAEFQKIIAKELMMPQVDVLQAMTLAKAPKNAHAYYYVECIDGAELEDQEDAIADSPNPQAMRDAYQTGPSYFYVELDFDGIAKKWSAKILDKETIRRYKEQKVKLVKVF